MGNSCCCVNKRSVPQAQFTHRNNTAHVNFTTSTGQNPAERPRPAYPHPIVQPVPTRPLFDNPITRPTATTPTSSRGFTSTPRFINPIPQPPESLRLSKPHNPIPSATPTQTSTRNTTSSLGYLGSNTAYLSEATSQTRPDTRSPDMLHAEDQQIVTAVFPFTSNQNQDLQFQPGDRLEIIDPKGFEPNGWMRARHMRTGKVGIIPGNYVRVEQRRDSNATPNVAAADNNNTWFMSVNVKTAENLLRYCDKGTFLIRESRNKGIRFTLSVKCDVLRVEHFRVQENTPGRFNLGDGPSFSSMDELIAYYKANEVKPDTGIKLFHSYNDLQQVPREADIAPGNLREVERLGAGNFAEVWKGYYGNQVVAIKKATRTQSRDAARRFEAEANRMYAMNHENLVKIVGICRDEQFPKIVMEFMDKGSLKTFLLSPMGRQLRYRQLVNYLLQVANGMKYLESLNYVHCDLRADNCLVNGQMQIKIADFGLCRPDIYSFDANFSRPMRWTSPEAFAHDFTVKNDVWSFGILCHEVVTRQKPYGNDGPNDVSKKVKEGYRLPFPGLDKCTYALSVM